MMKKIIILLLILIFSIQGYAQEVITDFSDESLVILNRELNKLNRYSLRYLNPETINIASYLYADEDTGLWLGNTAYASAPFRVSTAGALYASSATLTGSITATSGAIGGFTIGAGALTAGTGASAVGLAPGTYPFYAGNATAASAPFRVSSDGTITATSAVITGNITAESGTIGGWLIDNGNLISTSSYIAGPIVASSGSIGGWTIAEGLLTAGSGASSVGLAPGTYPFYAGNATASSAPFRVSSGGSVTATSGNIGGWTLGTNTLTGGNGSTAVGLAPATYPFYAGNATPSLAPFSVSNAGVIKATSGTIGGWTLAETTLTGAGSPNLIIDSGNSKIETSDYVSGALGTGWHIGTDTAEFNNIRARGKITTSVFEQESISIVGGNLIVLGGDVLDEDMTALDSSTLTISGDITFAVGDILRIKDGVDDEWFEVTNISLAPIYTVTRDKAGLYISNTNPIWKAGTAIVDYGQSGQGGIFLTSSENNAPYISFFTHAGSPWTTTTNKARLGNLVGIPGCSGYGIWGGAGYLGALQVIDIISISSQGAIRSNISGNYPYVELSNSGLQLKNSDTGGTYSIATYSSIGYGYGALVWIMNSDFEIPWMELKEPTSSGYTVSSIRLYNRGANPTGAAEIGDLAVVNGKLMICTSAGDPGGATWTIVGSQS